MAANDTYLDKREFQKSIQEYLPTTRKALPQVLNERGLNVAFRWQALIPKADKSKMEAELGVTRRLETNRKGKQVSRRTINPAPFIYGIVNARRRDRGEAALVGADMAKAAKAFIASRARSIAFLKSGCIQIIRMLSSAAKKSVRFGDRSAKQYGKAKGSAVPAVESWTPVVTLINSANSGDTKGSQALQRYGAPAAQRAMNEEARELIRHTRDKLQKIADKHNAR